MLAPERKEGKEAIEDEDDEDPLHIMLKYAIKPLWIGLVFGTATLVTFHLLKRGLTKD